jgi:NDP-sugar pyrophosphorylase family protein
MPDAEKISLENDFFPKLAGKKFYGYRVDRPFIDIGTPERYASVQQSLNKGHNSGD